MMSTVVLDPQTLVAHPRRLASSFERRMVLSSAPQVGPVDVVAVVHVVYPAQCSAPVTTPPRVTTTTLSSLESAAII